jgi:hypothetical protein
MINEYIVEVEWSISEVNSRREIFLSATFFTPNPTPIRLGLNPGLDREKPPLTASAMARQKWD